MFRQIKKIMVFHKNVLLFLVGLIVGALLTRAYYERQHKVVVESTVLLEQIKQVTKVIAVEGYFTEIMSQNAYQGNFGFFWDKKAIVQVRAKVSAGYDLNRMQIDINEKAHTVTMRNLPKAEILAIDHQLAYYDLQEGIFEGFTAKDYTQINTDARQKIQEAAMRSNLLTSADAQGKTLLMNLKNMIEQAGWTVTSDFAL
jgi:Protein of unknown function (DUF4230)